MDRPKTHQGELRPTPQMSVISPNQFSLRHHATDVKERSLVDMMSFIGIPTPKYEEVE